MGRRRIWEIDCFGMDTVLSTSFDADELMMIDSHFKSVYDIPDHPDVKVPHEILVYAMAHKACHTKNVTSEKIDRRLNAMHSKAIEAFDRANKIEVISECYYVTGDNDGDVPGCIWAVVSDSRKELRQHARVWIQSFTIRAMRYWMAENRSCAVPKDDE